MNNRSKDHLFLRACRGEAVERTPIWIMRQAGRYLPAYRRTRALADFQQLYRTPKLAAEVTIQPVELLGFDAAILFSDILVVPEAMGMKLEFHEGSGPRFHHPVRTREDFKKLRHLKCATDLDYVFEAISLVKTKLAGQVPLIGFCGSPWTLATYMIEGQSSRNFTAAKTMLYRQPELLHELLDRVTETLRDYLNAQLRAGADALQIFDSWGETLSPEAYRECSFHYIQKLIAGLHREKQPVIYFLRGRGHGLAALAGSGAEVLSLDWTIDLAAARRETGDGISLQGNLDPGVLLGTPEKIRAEAQVLLNKMRGAHGHIFNLGHGILPETPVENVKALIGAVRELSGQ